MFKLHTNTILVSIVVILSTFLLIGGRFEATWAGGEGIEQHQLAKTEHETFRRGEIISSEEEFKRVEFGNALIWMDRNTEVKLVDGRKEQLAINVIQGRIVVKGELVIHTREIRTYVDGVTSFVHYSWEDRIEIASIEGTTLLLRNDRREDISGMNLSTTTLKPYTDEDIEFSPEASTAADFYEISL